MNARASKPPYEGVTTKSTGVVCPGLSSKSVLPFINVYDRFCRINVSLCWSDSYQSSIRHGPTLPFMTVQICLGHLHPIWADSLQFLIRNGPTLPFWPSWSVPTFNIQCGQTVSNLSYVVDRLCRFWPLWSVPTFNLQCGLTISSLSSIMDRFCCLPLYSDRILIRVT